MYALGAVLYEMLTGDPPFTGRTAQAVVARVVTESPRPLLPQRHTIPPHVEAAVLTALEKLPADRFATAAQFAEALGRPGMVSTLSRTAATASVAPSAARSMRGTLATLAPWTVAMAAAAVAAVAVFRRPETPARHVVRFGIQLPKDAEPVGATGSTIAFSPDGSQVVYVGKAGSGQRLYARRMDRPEPVAVPGSDGGSLPFFSPDGQWLGFVQGKKLVKVALAGGVGDADLHRARRRLRCQLDRQGHDRVRRRFRLDGCPCLGRRTASDPACGHVRGLPLPRGPPG